MPRSTLRDRFKGINACITGSNKGFVGGFAPVFTEEDELCHYIINIEARLLGLTREDVRVLAFQMAERNGRPHRLNTSSEPDGGKRLVLRIHGATPQPFFAKVGSDLCSSH